MGPIGPGRPRRDVLDASPNAEELPSFLAGTLVRFCFYTALRERLRGKMANDTVGETHAWKLFGLVPMMLLHRPKHTGSVGGMSSPRGQTISPGESGLT